MTRATRVLGRKSYYLGRGGRYPGLTVSSRYGDKSPYYLHKEAPGRPPVGPLGPEEGIAFPLILRGHRMPWLAELR